MKKLLTGFTLAEILITLAIIGVVARVTLPALMSNVREQQTTTTLAKALNTLELGNQRIFTATSSTTLTGAGVAISTKEVGDKTVDEDWALQPSLYLGLLGTYLNGQYSTRDYTVDGDSKTNLPVFMSKDGIAYVDATSVTGLQEPRAKTFDNGRILRKFPEKYDGKYAKILVDLNGLDSPNKVGKDQFIFYIDNKGAAVPYGGWEYAKYALYFSTFKPSVIGSQYEFRDAEAGHLPLWQFYCNSGSSPKELKDRATCSGSIIDNGYKIIYNY